MASKVLKTEHVALHEITATVPACAILSPLEHVVVTKLLQVPAAEKRKKKRLEVLAEPGVTETAPLLR